MAYAITTRVEERRVEDWRAAVWAGVIGGAVFMMLEMIMVPLFMGMSAWAPPRMIAAIVMGQGVLPPPATFDMGVLIAAILVHFPLSIIYGLVGAVAFHRLRTVPAVIVGAALGLALYLINFYGFTALFPWFADARNWVSIFAHVAFGMVVAWSYEGLVRPPYAQPGAVQRTE